MATTTQELINRIDAIPAAFDKRLSPLEDLLKHLKAPASRAGMTPEQFFAKQYGQGNYVIGPDGNAFAGDSNPYTKKFKRTLTPLSYEKDQEGNNKHSFGRMCNLMWEAQHPYRTPEAREAAQRELHDPKAFNVKTFDAPQTKAAMAESSGLTGGYTVPVIFSEQFMYLAVEDTLMIPRARHLPMPSAELLVPSLDQTTTPVATNTQFFGGIKGTWAAEAALLSEAEPQTRQTSLKANQISFFAVVSNVLLQDNAVGLESLLTTLFPQAIGWHADFAFLQGNGVGKPLGVLNAQAAISQSRQTGSRFFWIDAVKMLGQLYIRQWDLNSVFWAISPTVLNQLFMMNDASTSTTVGRAIWTPINAGAQELPARSAGACSVGYLLGKPVLVTEKLPALGTAGDVMLIDASNYLIGDRMDTAIDVSPHVNFTTNQMVWRVIARMDGQPWLNNPITLQDTTTKVSPFVFLT